jgi:heterodisulfide reductase subunit B
MKYAYYPGCSLLSTSKEYNISTKAVCQTLGIELVEIPDWTCCGATSAHSSDELLSYALPIKNLIWPEKENLEVVTSCAACFNRLKLANLEVKNNPSSLNTVNKILNVNYSGKTKVKHLLEIITSHYVIEVIVKMGKKPLTNLKTACYYGCLLNRPTKVSWEEDNENPNSMDNLMKVLGATNLEWEYKTECCGASFSVTQTDIVLKLSGNILEEAKNVGAECIVVACPMCYTNLDFRQKEIEKKMKKKFNIPIIFFTELLGLYLGLNEIKLGLNKHMVNPIKLLKGKGIV